MDFSYFPSQPEPPHIYVRDGDTHQKRYIQDLTPEEIVKIKNKSRNYVRYQMSRNRTVGLVYSQKQKWLKILTPGEIEIIEMYHTRLAALRQLKMAFFSEFYKNCEVVGCTLKRKQKKYDII